MSFGKNDITGAVSGFSSILVWDAQGRLKVIGGGTPPPPAPVVWGTITGIVTNQTDLITYLGLNYYPLSSNPAGYLTQTAADLLYYPLSSNPAGYITSAALTGYVPTTRTLTINGTSYDLSADRSWTIAAGGTVTSIGLTVPPAFSVTPGSITTSGTFVITGAGTISQYIDGTGALQAFPTIPTVTPSALTKTDDTNVTLTLGGTPATALLQSVSLTLGWTGTLATGRGGTGLSTIGTALQYLRVNSGGTALEYATLPTIPAQYNPTAGTGISITGSYPNQTITNTLPDQTVVLTAGTGISTSGTYPNFTITNTSPSLGGTVTSVQLAAGTGISLSGTNPITTSGTITVTNSAPDQTVVLTAGTAISITGTYPNFGIANTAPDQIVSLATTGTGFAVTGTYPSFTLQNTLPDQTVVLTAGTGISVTGTYPSFTINNTSPGAGGGGTGGRNYYLNGGTVQGTFGAITDMREMSPIPVVGTNVDFTINADGYIKSFITDAGDPNQTVIPAGNWNFELWFSASSGGGSPQFWVEVSKWDGSAFTLIATSSGAPESITNGTATDLYFTALAVPQTTLTSSDRLAVRVYVIHSGRTITLHTQDSHLCQIITTFPSGLVSLNGLTGSVQTLSTGTTGTDFGITSSGIDHTFNLPVASAANTGKLSSTDWSTFNNKVTSLSAGTGISIGGTTTVPIVTNTAPDQTVILSSGTGINVSGTYPSFTVTNSAPDQVVALTPGTGIGITGTYPNFTITNSSPSSGGTVTSVSGTGTAFGLTLTGTVTTSGNLTLGGTLAVPIANITATGTPSATTFLRGDGSWATPAGGGGTATIGATIDGSGGTITIGQKGYIQVPYACTINSWRLIANASGSIVVDVWKAAAPTIPTVANTITGSALPTLSSQQTAASSTLTGWTTSVAANDIIGFNVDSATTVSWVILQLLVTKI